MPYATSSLREKTILIAEDEYFLADYIAVAITSASGVVDGPFASVAAAMARLASDAARPDAATLNISLSDGVSYPVADELRRLGIPFVFASAYGAASLPARFGRTPILIKPFAAYQVVQALAALTGDRGADRGGDGGPGSEVISGATRSNDACGRKIKGNASTIQDNNLLRLFRSGKLRMCWSEHWLYPFRLLRDPS